MKDENIDKDNLVKFFSSYSSIRFEWCQRKEIAAWTATAFYVVIMWFTFNFIFGRENIEYVQEIFVNFWLMIVLVLSVLLLLYIIFRFIHSQYAGIYDMQARANVYENLIYDITIDKVEIKDIKTFVPELKKKTISERKTKIQPKLGQLHPIKILFYFLIIEPLLIFRLVITFNSKESQKKWNKHKLNNIERHEAALYSMILLFTAILIYFFYILLSTS